MDNCGQETSMMTYPPLKWSCLKLEKQLRINLSDDVSKAQSYAPVVVHVHTGLDFTESETKLDQIRD